MGWLHLCTMSCLNSIPSKALSCVIRTPLSMPNKAANKSIYKVPRNPLDMLHQEHKRKYRPNEITWGYLRKNDAIKSQSNHHPRNYILAFHVNTYYYIKSSICCHCNTNTRNTNCWSYNVLGKFCPVKKYFSNKHYKIDRKETKNYSKYHY